MPEQLRAWLPAQRRYATLGTDGFGRSDSRALLRKHFAVSPRHIVWSALQALTDDGLPDAAVLPAARERYDIVPGPALWTVSREPAPVLMFADRSRHGTPWP